MQPGQREIRVVMVEGDIRPFGGFMAGGAIGTKLSVVFVLRGMTGITILGSALVNVVDMTRCAHDGGM